MTKEELLRIRYRVEKNYPNSPFSIGDILMQRTPNSAVFRKQTDHSTGVVAELYPHIFRKLEWHKERDINDMPEYIKIINKECSLIYGTIKESMGWGVFPDEGNNYGNEGDFFTLIQITEDTTGYEIGELIRMHVKNIMPATEQEYLTYIESLKK